MYAAAQQRALFDLSKQLLADTTASDIAQRAEQLRQVIHYHEWRYYQLNDPVVSDFEYDTLYKQLESIEAAQPHLRTEDSPTQRVSTDLTSDFAPAPHFTQMLSLENTYNADDLNDFDAQIRKLANIAPETEIEYCVEPKFDGGTIALVYENDLLVRAATRGNGSIGDDITPNAKVMRTIPLRAEFSTLGLKKVELRGEALIRKDNFETVNQRRADEGETLFANPRNAATGGLRTKDPKETAARALEAFVYQISYISTDGDTSASLSEILHSHHESIELLGKLGFKVPMVHQAKGMTIETKVCKNITEVADFCAKWQDERDAYGYEIDGMVVKVNNLATQALCGSTSHHPRWAVAYKFKAKQATTKLLNVEYQVGKIGSITPVAKLEPVALAGVTVSSVSLHNQDFITEKDLRIGDTVLVERAGDVIPYIVKAMDDLRDGTEIPIEYPRFCPINRTEQVELVRVEGEAAWRCPVCTCGAQDIQRFIFHVSKDAMDMEGLSKATVERFVSLGWWRTLPDLYELDYSKIAQLDGFGERSAENIRKSIEKAKQNPIHRLLYSLSIHHAGKKVSKLLAAEIPHVLALREWDAERFTDIKDVGPVVAANVIAFFAQAKNIEMLERLESLGVNLTQTDEDRKFKIQANTEGALAGKSILFTGSLSQYKREDAEAAAAAQGASIASGVSSKLSILVVGEKAGSKLKKAQTLGTVTIWTEQEFVDFLASATTALTDDE